MVFLFIAIVLAIILLLQDGMLIYMEFMVIGMEITGVLKDYVSKILKNKKKFGLLKNLCYIIKKQFYG
jgi:hypothetical protein